MKSPFAEPTSINRSLLIALEPRQLFDGALSLTLGQVWSKDMVLQATGTDDGSGKASVLWAAQQEMQQRVTQWMASTKAAEKLHGLFSGGGGDSPWLPRIQSLLNLLGAEEDAVRVELRSAAELHGVWGAFARVGPQNEPVIYLNREWLSEPGQSPTAVARVLVEEWGHYLDTLFNGALDTPGDEGEAFASSVFNQVLSEQDGTRIVTENDHLKLLIDGQDIDVEMASIVFSGQSYFAGLSASYQKAGVESNTLVVGAALPGTRTMFVSDPTTDVAFNGSSGNVRGTLYALDANGNVVASYYGELSRLIKVGSTVVASQFYVYPSGTDTSGDGVVIVVDFYATTPNFQTGDVVKSSSDPLASALNSLTSANTAPVANADIAVAVEQGGVTNTVSGVNPQGNVISGSDTDANQDTLVVTQVINAASGVSAVLASGSKSVVSASTVAGLYGSLSMGADGSYSYLVNNSLAAVQALRLSTDSLIETYTYSIADGKGGTASTTLTITLKGSNDAPVAVDDYNVAKASLLTNGTQYTATDPIGFKAFGNVLPNDTDVDAGDGKSISGLFGTAQSTGTNIVNSPGGTSYSFTTSSGWSSVKAGFYAYYLVGAKYEKLMDSAGNPITITNVGAGSFALSGTPAKYYTATGNVSINSLTGAQIGFDTSQVNELTSTNTKYAQVAASTSTGSSTVSLSTGQYSGTIAQGMAVSGPGVPSGTTVSAVNYDVNGNPVSVTLNNTLSTGVGDTINFTGSAGTTLTGRYGTLVLNADGSYVYTPTSNPGAGVTVVEAFKYTMQDSAGATSTATLYINLSGSGVNDPKAVADTATATEAGGLNNATAGIDPTANVLSNDTIGTGTGPNTVLSLKSMQSTTETSLVTGSISYGGVTYDASVTGLYGTAYIKANGTYVYVVNNGNTSVQALSSGQSLSESFQYKVSNVSGTNYALLTLTINGANDTPVAVADTNAATVGIYNATGNVLSNDSDVDALQTHTVTKVVAGNSTPTSVVAAGSTSAVNFTTLMGAHGVLQIGADGSYTYVVNTNDAAVAALKGATDTLSDVFSYENTDAGGLKSISTLTMTVRGVNDPPVNTVPLSVSLQEGGSFAWTGSNTLSVNDVDDNLSALTITVAHGTLHLTETSSTGSFQTLETTLQGGAMIYGSDAGSPNGTASITLYGTKAQLNAALATLVYTANAGYVGADSLAVQSLDALALKDNDMVPITVVGAPVTVSSPTVNEGSPFTVFTVTGVEGQLLKLQLDNTSVTTDVDASLGTDVALALEYFNGSAWVAYAPQVNNGYVSVPSNGNATLGEPMQLLVRVANINDGTNEPDETFTLTAITSSATSATGVATLVDDGNGAFYPDASPVLNGGVITPVTSNAVLDDDRVLTVNNLTVNEASPYAVFTVTGANSQLASLSLSAGTATVSLDYTAQMEVSADGGATWAPYTSGLTALSGTTGSLLVRIPVLNDSINEADETFMLTATNTGGAAVTGVVTLVDDGNGTVYNANGSVNATAPKDDDRALGVQASGTTVNEASNWSVFTVSGAVGQIVTLAISEGTGVGFANIDETRPLQIWNASANSGTGAWENYATSTIIPSGGKLLVRVDIRAEQDGVNEPDESFSLVATSTGGESATGMSIIVDDGNGVIFPDIAPANASTPVAITTGLDDDRVLSVNTFDVNEGSPYAVFTVTGASGQSVWLSLSGATGNPTLDALGGAAALGTTLPSLEYLEAGVWKTYNATTPPVIAGNGTTMLVRVSLAAEQDTALDGPETFNLLATNAGGIVASGAATILDNGTGSYFAADNHTATSSLPLGVSLDDDRPLSVGNLQVNEGSPYAVFTVSGAANQLTTLALNNVTTTGLNGFQYDNGSGWVSYTGGLVALDGNGLLRVRSALSAEQEASVDNGETFTLRATNTGGTSATGTATVNDDGTGSYWLNNDNIAATHAQLSAAGVVLDDDRALSVNSVTVNEAAGPAVFTVTGVAGQQVKLALQCTGIGSADAIISGVNADIVGTTTPTLRYSTDNGATWQAYADGSYVRLVTTALLLEVSIVRDALVENTETFDVVATNTGGATATGTGTITDYAPTVTPVTASALEAGGYGNTGGTDLRGDLVTTAGWKLDAVAFGSTNKAAMPANDTLPGAFGTLTFKDDGAWSYAVNNGDTDVQALLASSNTLTDTFTYTVKDAYGAQSSSTLTITIHGANDAPTAYADYNVAKESIQNLVANQYVSSDPQGFKATGNVLPNDNDVDAGDGKSLALTGSATGSVSGSSTVTTSNPDNFSSRNGQTFPVFVLNSSSQYVPLLGADGLAVTGTITGTGSHLTVTISDTSKLTTGTRIYLETSSGVYGNGGTVDTIVAPSSANVSVSGNTGTIAVGMTVGGTGLATAPTVTAVSRDGAGNVTAVTLSGAVAVKSANLTFTQTGNVTLAGTYGNLVFGLDGSYTYTPTANNASLNEGQSADEVFNYTMRDTAGLTSASTLTITVLGSGTNDPNAKPDTNLVIEKANDGTASTTTGNVLTVVNASIGDVADSTPGGTSDLVVSAARMASDSNFIAVTTSTLISGLYGDLTLNSDGTYNYALDNTRPAVQALKNASDTLTEQFQYQVQNTFVVGGVTTHRNDVATLTITIQGVNDAPVLDLDTTAVSTDFAATFTEGGSAVSLINPSDLNLTDVDSTSFNQVSLTFSKVNFPDANESLLIDGTTLPLNTLSANTTAVNFTLNAVNYAYTVTDNAGVMTLSFKGHAGVTLSRNEAEALLEGLYYQNTSNYPTGGSARVFILSVMDSSGLTSNPALSTITVVPVNDAPVIDLSTSAGYDYTTSYTVGGASVTITSGATVSDVDDVYIERTVVKLVNAQAGDALNVGPLTGMTSMVDTSVSGVITVTLTSNTANSITQAQMASAINHITFHTTGTSYVDRYIEVAVNDGLTTDLPADRLFSNTAVSTIVVNPDNRALTVTGTTVNEGSPFVLFTVAGVTGQRVSLELAETNFTSGNASLGLDTANPTNLTASTVDDVPLQYFDGVNWLDYPIGTSVTLNGNTLLVRTAVVNDSLNEGTETLRLIARNDAGIASNSTGSAVTDGVSQIRDDGLGDYFDVSSISTSPAMLPVGVSLDDDRPLVVSSVSVNEASPYAVFTVTGVVGQKLTLGLSESTGVGFANIDETQPLQVWNPSAGGNVGAWENYSALNTIPTGGTLLVRTDIRAERDAINEPDETFLLVATNTGGVSASGVGTIVDDGNSVLYPDVAPTNGSTPTTVTGPSAALDDDRMVSVNSITVNEGSPYAVFSVSGATGQWVTLGLLDGTTSPASKNGVDYGNASSSTDSDLEYFSQGAWLTYTTGTPAQIPNGQTTLLVRTAIVNDILSDNHETFRLQATNTGLTSAEGTATIVDDGSGTKWSFTGQTDAGTASTGPGAGFDDDRPVTVTNPTVNEASPYAVFTVDGELGQLVSLNLNSVNAAANIDYTNQMEVSSDGGLTWMSYASGLTPLNGTGGTLLVRVPVLNDNNPEPDETFTLTATRTNGATTVGTATIQDDGNGDIYNPDGSINTTQSKDNDNAVTVTSPTVNEASPYTVFTVDGDAGQWVSLHLSAGTATASQDYADMLEFTTDGVTWTRYTGGLVQLNGTGGTLQVRVPVSNDSTNEPDETFTLKATTTGGVQTMGTATIQDDGNGDIYNANGTLNTGALKDDDRLLSVSSVSVNEASPYAVFSVTGGAGQRASLSLTGQNNDGHDVGSLWWLNGSTWTPYATGDLVTLDASGHLLVRADITAEQDAALDGPETFRLVATNSGGTDSAGGVGTIRDDGAGEYFASSNLTATSMLPPGMTLDDDRPLSVSEVSVNEGSPFAVFTVIGKAGQLVVLDLAGQNNDGHDVGPLWWLNGSNWTAYSPGDEVPLDANGQLLVRTDISAEQDSFVDGPEPFRLVATNLGGVTSTGGTGTIRDDGSGSYFAVGNTTGISALPANQALDDDRVFTVTGGVVNEGSNWAVFSLTGVPGQVLTLSTVRGVGLSAADVDFSRPQEYWDADANKGHGAWVPYSQSVQLPLSGQLLVRVDIRAEQDAQDEIDESFQLVATNGSGRQMSGTYIIVDDGNGVIFSDGPPVNATTPAYTSAALDDDRPLQVDSPVVNEGSPYVFFAVRGASQQKLGLQLGVASDTATAGVDYEAMMDVSVDGVTWTAYSSGLTALGNQGELFVRVPIKQDFTLEKSETLTLKAINTGQQASLGTSRIVDEANGTLYRADGSVDNSGLKDDDRAKATQTPVQPAPIVAMVATSLPTLPTQMHVLVTVAQARQAVPAAVADLQVAAAGASGASILSAQRMDAMVEKYDRPLDPNLFVLPAVSSTRAQAQDVKMPALGMQSGLLNVQNSTAVLEDTARVMLQISSVPLTLGDQTLAQIAQLDDHASSENSLDVEAESFSKVKVTSELKERQRLLLAALRAADVSARTGEDTTSRGHLSFSHQLRRARM